MTFQRNAGGSQLNPPKTITERLSPAFVGQSNPSFLRRRGIMNTRSSFMKNIVRPIALAWVAIGSGGLVGLILEISLDIQLSKLTTSLITFVIAAFAAFILFPKIIKQPFETSRLSLYLRKLGFYCPEAAWKHILLGIVLAVCTLSGMLIGSLLTGRYVFDRNTINATQIIFSINPGIWEEFFYRGVIMFLFLKATQSFKRAAILQVILFGATHIKGVNIWSWVDVISVIVIAVAFTYAAYKTRTLITGIIFHFVHDALLFVPQVPGNAHIGLAENIAFFGSLWAMVAFCFVLIKIASEQFGVAATQELFALEKVSSSGIARQS
jgi:membrane protease YdiL (CAAX protease family)